MDQLQEPAALGSGVDLIDFPGLGGCGPTMNREASPLMKRENPTPGSHFSGPSTHETRMTHPVVCASLVDWNSLDFRDLGSRFIAGLALHQWTFSRSMSGRTLGPDGAVSQSSGPWFYGPRRGRSTNEPRSRSTIELRKSDAWIAFFGRVHP